MSYRFKPTEKPAKSFRRVVAEQVDIALAALPDAAVESHSVHSGRKALKRLRALVRCAAPAIGKRRTRMHERALRDIARMLSHRRDADVALETLSKLQAEPHNVGSPALAALRAHLEQRRAAAHAALTDVTIKSVRQRLIDEGQRLAATRFKSRGMKPIIRGVQDCYAEGRRACKRAYRTANDENFHALRKSVQLHWRHMALLSRAWPEYFNFRVDEARVISELLGDDHDLAMLKQAACNLPQGHRQLIADIISAAQADLRMRAKPRVERLFADKPAAFGDCLKSYWKTGRRMKQMAVADAAIAAARMPSRAPDQAAELEAD